MRYLRPLLLSHLPLGSASLITTACFVASLNNHTLLSFGGCNAEGPYSLAEILQYFPSVLRYQLLPALIPSLDSHQWSWMRRPTCRAWGRFWQIMPDTKAVLPYLENLFFWMEGTRPLTISPWKSYNVFYSIFFNLPSPWLFFLSKTPSKALHVYTEGRLTVFQLPA